MTLQVQQTDEESIRVELPDALRARLDGHLRDEQIAAWSVADVDERGRYAEQFVLLTDQAVWVWRDESWDRIAIGQIASAKVAEGLGADTLRLLGEDRVMAEIRYTRRYRRSMTRLHRKLERRLPRPDGELPPPWLELVERQAEQKEFCPRCQNPIPAYAEGVCPQCTANRKILWRLLDVTKPYRMRVWGALALTLLFSAIAVFPPVFQKRLIDHALVSDAPVEDRLSSLAVWSSLAVGALLLMQVIGGLRLHMLTYLGTRVARDLRHQVYAHMHSLSLRFFGKRRTGSLITRVTNDTDRLWDFIVFGSVNLVRDIIMIVVFAGVMFWFNWRLAIVALLPVPLLGVITYYRSLKMQAMFSRLWTYWSRMTAVVGDALPGVRVVKAFSNEDREIERFDRRSDEYTERELAVNRVWATLQPVIAGMMATGRILVWIVGGYLLIRHPSTETTFGTLVMFTAFVNGFYEPIMELANSNRMVTRAASSAQRVFEVLDTPPEIHNRPDAIVAERIEGRVEFRQVSFSYEGAQPALREVSLVVEPGEMIGLCGPSGAGKSTLVNLICRFFDATDGQILIDGVDVRDYDVHWLRRQIGVVLQEPYLFHGTISDNIRYGNPDATDAEVIAAAKAANAHDFIVGFPDGYDTMVGERGQSLSGGERQRISVARAILHNPKILILDEATSSVDTETEKQIQQALDRLVQGRTTFAIAHRLSTLQAADRLVVLEKGRIAEMGRHDELVDRPDGVYARLHRTQVELNKAVAIQ